ncbi:cyclin-T1-3-like isoform X1 [Vicia villosa]|uniref:cyclin-T1-3-like isoform X1 n=2 Tax=Vicia villosa TaxID=3911 RepID=UPI00273A928C|nr:cyclin-T1-3-like isoform X1 [Vicia villosa]XP_058730624.1 cyclin-T1-3-like isoform X1 [Vicia villosa]
MAAHVSGELPNHGASDENPCKGSLDKQQEALGHWYMSRKDMEENAPSRKDGIDLKKETYLRKSYCTFLQDLGMRLKVPQVTIATAVIFCHRFFLRQSHAKNDRRTIATVCMFLAGKVEETPRPLKDVIIISYEMIHKKDPEAAHRIKQKEVYEQQKELILLGERVVLATLGFDLNVQHPYKPLVEAIKKFNVAKNALAQVAWNFVNDGLRTSLCLQFKPHHIAAGAIFLAAKFLKVKLPSDGEKVWWQEFDVTPRQLEEVSNQMLELYEQNRIPQSQGNETEGATAGGVRASSKAPATSEEPASKQIASHSAPQRTSVENNAAPLAGTENQSNDGSAEMGSDITDHKIDLETRDSQTSEKLPDKDNQREVANRSISGAERVVSGDQDKMVGTEEAAELGRSDDTSYKFSFNVGRNLELREGPLSPKEAIKMIDKDKVKAALEKRRKERGEMTIKEDVMDEDALIERELENGVEMTKKVIDKDKVKAALEKMKKVRGEMTIKKDVMDEDDLIEKELEDGVELAVENEKNKRERSQSWSKPDDESHSEDLEETRDESQMGLKGKSQKDRNGCNAEEGEMIDDASSMLNNRKRKMSSPPASQPELKKRLDSSYYNDLSE